MKKILNYSDIWISDIAWIVSKGKKIYWILTKWTYKVLTNEISIFTTPTWYTRLIWSCVSPNDKEKKVVCQLFMPIDLSNNLYELLEAKWLTQWHVSIWWEVLKDLMSFSWGVFFKEEKITEDMVIDFEPCYDDEEE